MPVSVLCYPFCPLSYPLPIGRTFAVCSPPTFTEAQRTLCIRFNLFSLLFFISPQLMRIFGSNSTCDATAKKSTRQIKSCSRRFCPSVIRVDVSIHTRLHEKKKRRPGDRRKSKNVGRFVWIQIRMTVCGHTITRGHNGQLWCQNIQRLQSIWLWMH